MEENPSFTNDLDLGQANLRQNQLENKLNSYFENRKSSKPLNPIDPAHKRSSSSSKRETQNMDFKILFTRPSDAAPSKREPSQDIENMEDLLNRRESLSKRKTYSEYTLSKREPRGSKEPLSKKKVNLLEFKLKQLEQEVELNLQEKIDIYKQNEGIEREIQSIEQKMKRKAVSQSNPD